MNSDTNSVGWSLLDMPDEILVKIAKYLRAKERIPLGKSCTRLETLVFKDRQLMRNLDFSKNGCFVTIRDIRRYLRSDESACESVRVLNLRNVKCLKTFEMLVDFVWKATKLVELDIFGTKFKDVTELCRLLEPLTRLKKLSIDWPSCVREDIPFCIATLSHPLSRLTYLSVRVYTIAEEFFFTIKFCHELRELRIKIIPIDYQVMSFPLNMTFKKLRNLEVVQVCGTHSVRHLKAALIKILLDPCEWTEFQVNDVKKRDFFYLERNVDVCDELNNTNLKEAVPYQYFDCNSHLGWFVITEVLLKEVINITHQNVPETFCCFQRVRSSIFDDDDEEPCFIRIDDAKSLLKDPWHQISFLHFNHSIEPDCDAHLVASAFPNITELVLTEITKIDDTKKRTNKHLARRLRKRGESYSEIEDREDENTNEKSSFELLIENTPHVKDLTIFDKHMIEDEYDGWDLDALYLIGNWKSLTNLRLANVPVIDGKFLIHIGIHCPNLEILVLQNLGPSDFCCYTKDLCEMLKFCRNLKEFSMTQFRVTEISNILESIVNNSKLEKFSWCAILETCNTENLVTSTSGLLNSCKNLTKFIFLMGGVPQNVIDQLTCVLRRLRIELNRPNFQFQLIVPKRLVNMNEVGNLERVFEDESSSFFPGLFDRSNLN